MVEKSEKSGKIFKIILLFILVLAVGLLCYPSFANSFNSIGQTTTLQNYSDSVDGYNRSEIRQIFNNCRAYNNKVLEAQEVNGYHYTGADYNDETYDSLLNPSGDGVMGYIDIPSVGIYLPIGHGTSTDVLSIEVGHMHGTSLITGGESTHAVITAHTGLQSSKLFTDVDKLKKGDEFYIHVLNKTHRYVVDNIEVVLPEEADSKCEVVKGKDYVTLYTCTPYGVNTHRLLVRGIREDLPEERTDLDSIKGQNIKAIVKTIFWGSIPIVVLVVGFIFIFRKRNGERK